MRNEGRSTFDVSMVHQKRIKCRDKNRQEVQLDKVKGLLKGAVTAECQENIQVERWQGKFLSARREDDELIQSGCWDLLRNWSEAPSHNIAGIVEMYEQLTPTKLYTARKAKTTQVNDITCRMYGKAPENLPHVLAGCPALDKTSTCRDTMRLSGSCFLRS